MIKMHSSPPIRAWGKSSSCRETFYFGFISTLRRLLGKIKANWDHLRNIFTIIIAGALAVQFQVGFLYRKVAVLVSLSPPSSCRSGLQVGLWPPVPAGRPGLRVRESLTLGNAQPGRAGQGLLAGQKRPAWAWSPRRGSTERTWQQAHQTCPFTTPFPIFNTPNLDWDL